MRSVYGGGQASCAISRFATKKKQQTIKQCFVNSIHCFGSLESSLRIQSVSCVASRLAA